jgi:hypothetical protein
MTGPRAWLVAALVLAAGVATPAVAQRPMRSGFWLEVGGGGGNVHLGCSSCTEPTVIYGRSGYLRGGGAFTPRVLWGLELFGLIDEEFDAAENGAPITIENTSIAPVILWYPWRGGVFFKGGIGISSAAVITPAFEESPAITTSGTGSGLTFGAGLDVPLFRFLSVTANFGVYYSAIGDVALTGSIVDDVITTIYQANFAITLR